MIQYFIAALPIAFILYCQIAAMVSGDVRFVVPPPPDKEDNND